MLLAEQNLASLTSEAERMRWSKDAAPVYLGLAEAELVQGREQESLDVFEWYLGAPQRVGGHGPDPSQSLPDPSRLPTRLPLLSDQTVLAYGVLPDGLAIWVYDNRGVSAKWIPKSPQELQDLASDFYSECSDPRSEANALRRDSQNLYSLLIAPVEAHLDPKRTLMIETEGFMARLPFEALMDASGHYLIERTPIVYSPGPYSEARMRADTVISPDLPALIVGSAASSPDTGLYVIPNVLAGADTVAGAFHSPRVLEGPGATLSAVTRAMPAAAVFHFAGHAITTSNHTGLMLKGRRRARRSCSSGRECCAPSQFTEDAVGRPGGVQYRLRRGRVARIRQRCRGAADFRRASCGGQPLDGGFGRGQCICGLFLWLLAFRPAGLQRNSPKFAKDVVEPSPLLLGGVRRLRTSMKLTKENR